MPHVREMGGGRKRKRMMGERMMEREHGPDYKGPGETMPMKERGRMRMRMKRKR